MVHYTFIYYFTLIALLPTTVYVATNPSTPARTPRQYLADEDNEDNDPLIEFFAQELVKQIYTLHPAINNSHKKRLEDLYYYFITKQMYGDQSVADLEQQLNKSIEASIATYFKDECAFTQNKLDEINSSIVESFFSIDLLTSAAEHFANNQEIKEQIALCIADLNGISTPHCSSTSFSRLRTRLISPVPYPPYPDPTPVSKKALLTPSPRYHQVLALLQSPTTTPPSPKPIADTQLLQTKTQPKPTQGRRIWPPIILTTSVLTTTAVITSVIFAHRYRQTRSIKTLPLPIKIALTTARKLGLWNPDKIK